MARIAPGFDLKVDYEVLAFAYMCLARQIEVDRGERAECRDLRLDVEMSRARRRRFALAQGSEPQAVLACAGWGLGASEGDDDDLPPNSFHETGV